MEIKPKRGRPRKKNLVDKRRFAEMCGIKPDLLYQYTGGNHPKVLTDEDTGKVDIRDPVNSKFLELYKAKTDEKAILEAANAEQRMKIADLLKAESDAQWKAAKARKAVGDLIDKRIVEYTLDIISKTIRELLLPVGVRLSPELASICNTTDRDMIMKIQHKVDDEIGRALEDIKETITDSVENNDFFVTMDEVEDLLEEGDE